VRRLPLGNGGLAATEWSDVSRTGRTGATLINPRVADTYVLHMEERTSSDAGSMPRRTRIGRVVCFVAVAVAFSWAQWFAVIASQRGWITAHVALSPVAIFGPLVAAVTCLAGAPHERKRWLWSLLQWRMPPLVGFIAVFLPPLLFVCCLAVATAVTPGAPPVAIPPLATTAPLLLGMFLTAGVGEESGWRGVLLPELRKSIGSIRASLIVAIVWLVWHLPLFRVIGATQQQIPATSFMLGILAYSFILTWLVEVSNNGTLAAMLFHTSANVSFWLGMVCVQNLPQYSLFSRSCVVAIAACGAVAAVLLIHRDRKASHDGAQSSRLTIDCS
jgi:uncharacterized protein